MRSESRGFRKARGNQKQAFSNSYHWSCSTLETLQAGRLAAALDTLCLEEVPDTGGGRGQETAGVPPNPKMETFFILSWRNFQLRSS